MSGTPLVYNEGMFRGDRALIFLARTLRTFGFGLVSVLLPLHLARAGLRGPLIGLALSLTLAEDAVATALITAVADRVGRRRILALAPLAIAATGAALAVLWSPWALFAVTVIGVMGPGGVEAGPFMAVEQAVIAAEVAGHARTRLIAWYNVAGSIAAAVGALVGGIGPRALTRLGLGEGAAWRGMFWLFAAVGLALSLLALRLSPAAESDGRRAGGARTGLHRSLAVVGRLAAWQGLDALAGGLVVQSIAAYWLLTRFHASPGAIGTVFFGTNLLSAASYLAAAGLARRFGLLNTMVFTHLPSNALLCLVPLMPTFPLAAGTLVVRSLLSQMDVPTRQAYTMALVEPDERSAAGGLLASVRCLAAAVSPAISGFGMSGAALGWPFMLAGALKATYDLGLYATFRHVKLPEDAMPA